MGRKPCCDKVGLKRGPWTADEDRKLLNSVLTYGIHCWRTVPKLAGLLRCGKSCRLRWINYLRPDLKRGGFTEAEEDEIIRLHASLGNRWSKIASHFVGRTDNEIKNHWNTRIKKRLREMGVDALSHKSSANTKNSTKEASASPKVKNVQDHDQSYEGIVKNLEADNDDLLSNYEIFSRNLEVIEHWLNKDYNVNLDAQNSSVSLRESLNASTTEFSQGLQEKQGIIQEDATSFHQWFAEMDSIFELSNHLDDQLPFLY